MASETDPLSRIGHVVLFLVSVYWSGQVLQHMIGSGDPPWIPLDNVTLIFHEAGHWIFYFFGMFLYVLGGSLMQLLVPILVSITFYRQQSYFATGFGLFWLGDSLIGLSYYVADARAQQLQLLSDSALHDWNWLLTSMNLLPYDSLIGAVLHVLGVLTLIGGIGVMGYSLFKANVQSRLQK